MYRLIFFTGFSLIVGLGVAAQEPLDFNTLNNETYRLYLAREWDSVISLGKQGLRLDMDYHYLRMRMGIASYEKKRYRTASRHFSIALKQNQGDPAALEYLYYSKLLAGQTGQAELTRKLFKGDLAQKLPPLRARFFDQLLVETLYSTGVDDNIFNNPADLYPLDAAGTQSTTRYLSNTTISVVNRVAPGVRLSHAFTLLTKSNHYFTNDTVTAIYLPEQQVRQIQYYFAPEFTTRSGTMFQPMIHILGIRYQVPYDSSLGYMGGSSRIALGHSRETDWVTGLGFRQALGPLDLDLGTYYSRLNQRNQIQNRVGLTWYPLGNLNLYAGGYLNSQVELDAADGDPVHLIPEVLVGFAVAEKVWFEARGSMGDMSNYLENNGTIVFNSYTEIMKRKVNLALSIPVSGLGSLIYLGGRWTSNQSDFAADEPANMDASNVINYNTLSIYGGVLWKF